MKGGDPEIRRRAWETRRAKYGTRGHAGTYRRPQADRTAELERDCERMRAELVWLHVEGVLSEGQAAKATGLDRVELRRRADLLLETCP